MNTPDFNDADQTDFSMSDFERQLKSLAPRESTVNRDDLLFRAGYAAGIASVNVDAASCRVKEQAVDEASSRVEKKLVDEASSLIMNQTQDAASCLIQKQTANEAACHGELNRVQRKKKIFSRVAIAASIVFALIVGTILGQQIGERRAIARLSPPVHNQIKIMSLAVKSEPLPPVYATDEELSSSFASSNEPNYIELRDQVLRFGVDAMPESYSFAAPSKSSKERKLITPLSYGAVMETDEERF